MKRICHKFLPLFFIILFIACQPALSQPSVLVVNQSTLMGAPSPTTTPILPPATPPPAMTAVNKANPIFAHEAGSVVMEKANGIAVANGLAYVSSGAGLHVLDLSNPAVPRQIGLYPVEWHIMSTPPGEVVVAGSRAYLLVAGSVHLVDVSDPTAPRQVGLYQVQAGIEKIAAAGETLYLATGPDLLVVDVSNPTAPQELNRISIGWTRQVVVVKTTAYVIAGSEIRGLHIFDISNPAAPRQVGLYQTSAPIAAVAVAPFDLAQDKPQAANRAIILAYVISQEGLHIVDVSDPARPKALSVYTASGGGYDLAVARNTVYIASLGAKGYPGLDVLDVADPTAPHEIGYINVVEGDWLDSKVVVSEATGRVDVYVLASPGDSLLAFPEVKTALSRPLPQTPPAPLLVSPVEIPSPEPDITWTYYPLAAGLGYLHGMLLDQTGRVWVATPTGFYILEVDDSAGAAVWTAYKVTSLPDLQSFEPLAVDDAGRIWAGASKLNGQTWSRVIIVFDGSTRTTYTGPDSLIGGQEIHTIAVDRAGQVWAGTDEGLSKFDGQTWTRIGGAPVPARAIAFDQAGQVWVGSNVGVSVFDGAGWTAYPKAGNFEMQYVNAIDFDPEGNVWVAFGGAEDLDCTNTGLSKFDGQSWTNYLSTLFRDFCNDGPPLAIVFDQAGKGWVGMRDNVKKFDPKTLPMGARIDDKAWTLYYDHNLERKATGAPFDIIIDQAGNIWFKGYHGISRLQTLPLAKLTVVSRRTYKDPALGFSLKYEAAWRFEVQDGTDLNDGSGRTILLEKEGYQFRMMMQRRPETVGECRGVLPENALSLYWKYKVGKLNLWRARAEAGWVNSYHDNRVAIIDIIVPTELWDKPNPGGDIGEYTCSPQINDYIVSISYLLPVSVDDLKAGRFRPEILAEMDYILTSLTWK